MSYLGQVELKSSEIRRIDVTGSTSATHTLTWTPASEQSLIITINGIKQQNNYSISGVTLTLDDALLSADKMEVIGILDIGEAVVPPDDSISTAKIQDDAVTAAKLANSINTEITANTAKVTNATHTGDVTGATALTIATDAVDIAMLSATGTASATTFLRGDNAWVTPTDTTGKVLQVLQVAVTDTTSYDTQGAWAAISGMTLAITPSSTSSTILINTSANYGSTNPANTYCRFMRDSTPIAIGATAGSRILCTYEIGVRHSYNTYESWPQSFMYLDSPSTTSAITYTMEWYIEDSAATLYLNRSDADGDNDAYSRNVSTIILMEIGG